MEQLAIPAGDRQQAIFENAPGEEVTVKLIDAQFPPYEQVIPEEHKKVIAVGPHAVHRRASPRTADVAGDSRREGRVYRFTVPAAPQVAAEEAGRCHWT